MRGGVGQFLAELRRSGRRRLDLEALWRALYVVDPEAATAPDRRKRLQALLDQAERMEALVATRGRPDRSAEPPLPRSVTLAAPVQLATPGVGQPGAVWPAELAWAAHLKLQDDERNLLEQVRAFLRDLRADEPVVPMRERSLELTGDEKLLDEYLNRRLFRPGRLTLELLRCKRVHPPFVWQEIGPAPVLLAVENHHSFDTLGQVVEPEDGLGLLAYGHGNQFPASVGFVANLPRPVERILYYGDLDLEGLQIATRANAAAVSAGLPPVEPAAGLYRALLVCGRRGAASPVPETAAQKAVSWLPPDLRDPVRQLLVGGERMAQEGLGLSRLRDGTLRRQALREGMDHGSTK